MFLLNNYSFLWFKQFKTITVTEHFPAKTFLGGDVHDPDMNMHSDTLLEPIATLFKHVTICHWEANSKSVVWYIYNNTNI